ncbi:MAG: glutamate-5-semialdehyde dehydrogenase [Flavobacteriaceae bacterium]|nr:glutamate-5-semialdehyde dehydrogenase [Flavobacteriaceae bacterium]
MSTRKTLTINQRNKVLLCMASLVLENKEGILQANSLDVFHYKGADLSVLDRLKVDAVKVNDMATSLRLLADESDPLGKELHHVIQENGLKIINKTAPFGTVMIIYESRPDVTVEAGAIAFKSGNKIILKGGKEAIYSNLKLVELWHKALLQCAINTTWVEYLKLSRIETQEFLENPTQKIDLIIPRGGEKLIAFVKKNANCPVIVSGRGNNFLYVDSEADVEIALRIIMNSKTAKISACNALDKVLVNASLPHKGAFLKALVLQLKASNVTIYGDEKISSLEEVTLIKNDDVWYEEFLDYKIVIGQVASSSEAIDKINRYGGGHSAVIITTNEQKAAVFMTGVDAAAVYQNASTRFTDGGQFGLGGELAISTDKLHHRGPMGLQHLVTNKWYIFGNGQTR